MERKEDGWEGTLFSIKEWVGRFYLFRTEKKENTHTLETLLQENYKNTLIDTFPELSRLQGLRAQSPILPSLLTSTSSSGDSQNHPQVQ